MIDQPDGEYDDDEDNEDENAEDDRGKDDGVRIWLAHPVSQ